MNRIKNLRGRIDPDGRDVGGDRRKPAGRRPAAKPAASTPPAAPAGRVAGGASHDETDFLAGIFDEDKAATSVAGSAGASGAQRTETNGDADSAGDGDSKPRRRGRRGGRGRGKRGKADTVETNDAAPVEAVAEEPAVAKPKAASRRRGKTRAAEVEEPVETPEVVEAAPVEVEADETTDSPVGGAEAVSNDDAAPTKGRRRRTRGGRGRRRRKGDSTDAAADSPEASPASLASAAESAAAIEAADEDFTATEEETSVATDDEVDRSIDRTDDRDRVEPPGGMAADFDMDESWDAEQDARRVPVAEFDPDALDEEEDDEAEAEAPPPGKARRMLINVSDADECRIAILQEGRLDELYTERAAATSHVGNIYKGKVTNVESSIQAAFIDFGLPQHGFLHISDLHPQFFPQSKGEPELVGRKTPRRHRPPIQHCLRRGQEVIVQVIKEGIGTKGPTLTTYISLPGRFLVMMPGMDQLGVSRKIEDDDQRRKARDLLAQLSLPREMGFIVRTAGIDRTKRDLQRDLNYLVRLWKGVEARLEKIDAPAELYRESDLVIRTIRDVYDSTVEQIVVDNPTVAEKVREFLSIASPRARDIVVGYSDAEPLFYRYGIEAEIDKLHSKRVELPCGGSLVIESTEALVAIDVNSGKFRIPDNAEETAYRVNCEAVEEIARQLRLRDLGGLIICDMIDMMAERHCRDIENRFRHFLKQHKERAKILKMSQFGIIEMTRQRQRPSLAKSVFRECPRCGGTGRMKSTESVALDVMRRIRMASQHENVASIDVRVATAVANDLLNRKRHALTDLERASGQSIRVHGDDGFMVDAVELACTDRRGREIAVADVAPSLPPRPSSSGSSYPGPSSGGRSQQGRGHWQGGRRDRDRGPRRNDGRGNFGGGGNRGGGGHNRGGGGGGGHRSGGHGGGSNQGGQAGRSNQPAPASQTVPDNIGNRADPPEGAGNGGTNNGGGGGNKRGRRRRRR